MISIHALVSGRMALLITLFLVLINIFNNITTNSPKAEGLTAIEIWMLACILFVFGEIRFGRQKFDLNVTLFRFCSRRGFTQPKNKSFANPCTLPASINAREFQIQTFDTFDTFQGR